MGYCGRYLLVLTVLWTLAISGQQDLTLASLPPGLRLCKNPHLSLRADPRTGGGSVAISSFLEKKEIASVVAWRSKRHYSLATTVLIQSRSCGRSVGKTDVDYETASIKAGRLINLSDIRSALIYLASDSLQGRETTEPGQKKAAEFIVEKFKSFGLKPLGDNGTYLQHFPVDVHYISDSSFVAIDGKYFWNEKDIFVSPFGAADTELTAPVVFAGYGFQNDSYSDYKAIDVKNKIVMLLDSNPPFADTTDPLIRTGLYKRTNAARHGAAAVLLIVRGGEKGFSKLKQKSGSLLGQKTMTLISDSKEQTRIALMQMLSVSEKMANEVLKKRHTTVEQLAEKIDSSKIPASMEINKATVDVKINSEKRMTENVVGMLEGTDPILKKEFVVYSAHYDHLGETPDGVIYHGADDNASGTSTVLGIAEAYAKSEIKPRRSIIFLTVTGEEKGLLGSSYFSLHPVVPLGNIVADLNTDMDGRIDTTHAKSDSNYVYVIGSKRLSVELDSLLVAADSQSVRMNLDYSYDTDNDPNRFYYRSDHYNFAKKNIPIIFFFNGTHADYHKPTDTSDKIDFPILERRA